MIREVSTEQQQPLLLQEVIIQVGHFKCQHQLLRSHRFLRQRNMGQAFEGTRQLQSCMTIIAASPVMKTNLQQSCHHKGSLGLSETYM